MKHCKIAIPIDLVHLTNLDFSKPIYLHTNFEIIYLSNRKKRDECLGQINVAHKYAFTVHQGIVETVLNSNNYMVYVKKGVICIAAASVPRLEWNQKHNDRIVSIPSEILDISKVDFNKPIYLYMPREYIGYLSNKRKRSKCLGIISFDDNSFYLSDNMCKALEVKVADDMVVYVSNGIIY